MSVFTMLGTGKLSIVSREGLFQIKIPLHNCKDLYYCYCTSDIFIPNTAPIHSLYYLDGVEEDEQFELTSYTADSPNDNQDSSGRANLASAELPQAGTHVAKKGLMTPKSLTIHQKQLEVELWLA